MIKKSVFATALLSVCAIAKQSPVVGQIGASGGADGKIDDWAFTDF